MTDYNLSEVEVALFNPVHTTHNIRDAVHGAGLRRVKVVNSIDILQRAIRETEFDMLLFEAKENMPAIGEHVRDIRQGKLGTNPYVVIKIITWKPKDDAIRGFIDSGTDDIIVMPISIGIVTNRVNNIIVNRKKFIATLQYLGPDRRDPDSARDSELGGFDVPNGVRYKATGDLSARPDLRMIRRTNLIAKEQRLRRTAIRFGEIASSLEIFLQEHPGEKLSPKDLSKMTELVEHITQQVENNALSELYELVGSLQNVTNEAALASAPDSDLFALLRVHGEALLALLRDEEEASDLIVRAVFTAANIIDERAEKKKNSATDEATDEPS